MGAPEETVNALKNFFRALYDIASIYGNAYLGKIT